MKIEIFEVLSKNDAIYQELLELYKTNSESEELLDTWIIPPKMVLMGDFRIITVLNRVIDSDLIKVYLVKDTDKGVFLWVIGKWVEDGKINRVVRQPSGFEQLLLKNSKMQSILRDLFDNQPGCRTSPICILC